MAVFDRPVARFYCSVPITGAFIQGKYIVITFLWRMKFLISFQKIGINKDYYDRLYEHLFNNILLRNRQISL